mmetsp:Transcript_6228/g.13763  ORF Transcript_6228/g.13763 Transcript_6228/m.13763 type:complete len:102 (+) Transcript_6228:3-308(+)
MRECFYAQPGAPCHISDAARVAPSVSHQLRPDWQVVDAERKAQRTHARAERNRYYHQRTAAMAAYLGTRKEQAAERLFNGNLERHTRYVTSLASAGHAFLR